MPIPRHMPLQAVHELEDILALHLDRHAECLTGGNKLLLELREIERRAGNVRKKRVISRISTFASERMLVTPATIPGRFLPRTVMTTRLEGVSVMRGSFRTM